MEIIIAIIIVSLILVGINKIENESETNLDNRIREHSKENKSYWLNVAKKAKIKRNRAIYFMALYIIEENDPKRVSWSRCKEDRGELSDDKFKEICKSFLLRNKISFETCSEFVYKGMTIKLHNQGIRIFWKIINNPGKNINDIRIDHFCSYHSIINKLYPPKRKWYQKKRQKELLTKEEKSNLKIFGQYRFQGGTQLLSNRCEEFETNELLRHILDKVEKASIF